MKSRLLLLVLMPVCLSAMAGQVYSWTDSNGTKHFSDSPPPANVAKAQKIQVRGQLTTQTADEAQPAADDAAQANPGPALAAAAGYSQDDIKRNCEIANTNLGTLAKQVIRVDENGAPLDEEAASKHQAMVDKANQQVKLFCTPQ
ncbi:MAG: DUF4124 domain-containing protein [Rhodanobacteraceae bacterium]